jgi:hypothetical protein
MRWRYEGLIHEYQRCDDPFVEHRQYGDYHIESRRLRTVTATRRTAASPIGITTWAEFGVFRDICPYM